MAADEGGGLLLLECLVGMPSSGDGYGDAPPCCRVCVCVCG